MLLSRIAWLEVIAVSHYRSHYRSRLRSAAVLSLAFGACLGAATAATLFSESFDYEDGPLADQGGWSDTSAISVLAGIAIHDGSGDGDSFSLAAKHSLPMSSFGDTWIALEAYQLEVPLVGGAFGGISLFNNQTQHLLIGKVPGASDSWGLSTSPDGAVSLASQISSVAPQLVLVHIDFGTFFDVAELWVDPVDPLDPGPPHASVQGLDLSFNHVYLRSGTNGFARFAFDAITIATTLDELFPSPCPTDVDGSGSTDFPDLVAVLGDWGACPGCPADVDGNGSVGFDDLIAVLGAWGPCP